MGCLMALPVLLTASDLISPLTINSRIREAVKQDVSNRNPGVFFSYFCFRGTG